MFYMRLFKNENKGEGDNKPIYSNSNFTVKERVVLEPGKAYQIGMWKDKERDALNIKVDEKKMTTPQPSLKVEDDDIPY